MRCTVWMFLTTTRVFETKSFSSHALALSLAFTFIHSFSLSLSECFGEQAAAAALGYTQVSWDNLSGKEQQPFSSIKSWAALVATEKAAAVLLGYNQRTWDNDSGSEPRPASAFKSWSELAACGDGKYNRFSSTIFPPILLTGLGGGFVLICATSALKPNYLGCCQLCYGICVLHDRLYCVVRSLIVSNTPISSRFRGCNCFGMF